MYAYVEDGVIVRFGQLPKVWQFADGTTVSGFHLLEKATILEAGWYEVEDARPEYDEQTHYLSNPTYEVLDDKVVTRYAIEPYPEPEPEVPQGPTQEERIIQLESDKSMLQFKVGALTSQTEFLEETIAELILTVVP